MKKIVLFVLRLYKRIISPWFASGACRFTPTCSEYMYQAIERYGIIYGSWMGLKRIVRCHPWSTGGHDPL